MTSPDPMFAHLDHVLRNTSTHGTQDHTRAEQKSEKAAKPFIPESKAADPSQTSLFWKNLRAFYRGDASGAIAKNRLPALLLPFRDTDRIRFDYPVWIAVSSDDAKSVRTLNQLLEDAIVSFAPGADDAKILKDNRLRLEQMIRQYLSENGGTAACTAIWETAVTRLTEQLHLKGETEKSFLSDAKHLKDHLPKDGHLYDFSKAMALTLLSSALRHRVADARTRLLKDAAVLRQRLQEMILIEDHRNPEAKNSSAASRNHGYGSAFVDFTAVSRVLPASPTLPMAPARRKRITEALAILSQPDTVFKESALLIVTPDIEARYGMTWTDTMTSARISIAPSAEALRLAEAQFDAYMQTMTSWVRAKRIAQLESQDRYEADVHDVYFEKFDWRALSDEEVALCAPVVVLASDEEILRDHLHDFSTALASRRPIKFFVMQSRYHSDQAAPTGVISFAHDLAAMAVAHRQAYVYQAAMVHPEQVFHGIRTGLSQSAPSLFYMLAPVSEHALLASGSALESRAFPEYSYDPQRGVQWGSRFSVEANPQADSDWPVYELTATQYDKTETLLRLPFTFADHLVLDDTMTHHFMDVPPSHWTPDLVLLADYLALPPSEAYTKIPYVWTADKDGILHKTAVDHALVLMAQDRLDAWHFIQEFGGINSYHVARAIAKTRTEMTAEKERALDALHALHQSEIEKVREETARSAMEKLSAVLLDLDTLPVHNTPSSVPSLSVSKAETSATVSDTPTVSAPVEEEPVISNEAWLETIRCTSCNECINLNPNIFKYNSAKQAYIGDARAGSYLHIVQAAEKCPAKCIHPGLPLNLSEDGLDALIQRAAVFN
ncbi:ferredoxin [bacterium]|nr:ferredoxin [bacterium]NUN45405.1 ferredoxin [bacterium]